MNVLVLVTLLCAIVLLHMARQGNTNTQEARMVLRLAVEKNLIVLLAEDVLGRLNEYVRLAGRVCNGPAGGAALKGFSRQPCFS